ncbi:glycoside hydrolase family 3 protein [Enterococcus sp. AZ109]|uniref:glycoside hydrolase family 3 protein n=1 Tax=Enterococcus sp. AZ109 TaxID=2774634 RepID=UPI003F20326B
MKKYRKLLIPLVIVLAIAGFAAFYLNKLSQDGVLNMADVYATIQKVSVYLIPAAVLLVLIIIALIVFRNKDWKFKFWLKGESLVIMLIAIMLTVNTIIFGPMSNLFNLNYASLNDVSAATLEKNGELTKEIANEGTVLLKNTDNYLPLEDTENLNVFGWASTNPVYGGTGSGNVDTSNATTILSGLEEAGFSLNDQLSDFYSDYRTDRPEVGMWAQDWTLVEPKSSDYSDKLIDDAKEFSNTALIVISRVGGEGADLPTNMKGEGITYEGNDGDFEDGDHYLQLSKTERDMVDLVTDNFEDVIVLVNSSNAMELGWLNDYDNIKGALWMAGPGATGFSALGDILKGEVNPSGKTVDTFVYDLQQTPTWNNFGDFSYDDSKYKFIDYVENIYVGYKFYETYYQDNEEGYSQAVQYPLGYGLSYTTFEQTMGDLRTESDGTITFDVTVRNTGDVAGKDVVQVYFTPPYQDGGIEKAATNVLTFEKTDEIAPGESQTLTVSFNQEDMASFDNQDAQAYVLEEGEYTIALKENAHESLDSKVFTLGQTITYDADNKRSTDEVVATNQFTDFATGEVDYLSRADNFANYEETTARPESRQLTDLEKDGLTNADDYEIVNDDEDEMPKTGEKNGMELNDLVGLDFDDAQWETLLDQMTVKDMSNLITYGGYQTVAAKSVGKLQTYDFDGPAGISSFFVQAKGTAFPTATMIAATWNKELAKDRGEAVGEEAAEIGISGWYGPAMNIHRSAFSGRNFEYYSEDGVISGVMAANEIAGAKSKGVYSYMKHFALNDQETNRTDLLLTWSTEQAIREVYLKPFEMAVKDGGANAAMSAFNYIGNQWAGGSSTLLNTVLRDEWGFDGFVLTDYFGGYGYMDADKAIRNGNDMMLSTTGETGAGLDDTESATAVQAMRTAAHNILYTVVNSREYENYESASQWMPWQQTAIKVNIAVGVGIVAIQALIIYLYRRKARNTVK